jgi:hypothetical protein
VYKRQILKPSVQIGAMKPIPGEKPTISPHPQRMPVSIMLERMPQTLPPGLGVGLN